MKRYLLQFIVMLIGPIFILIGIYFILFSGSFVLLLVALLANFLAWKDGAWDVWKPSVIKKFMENAKRAGL